MVVDTVSAPHFVDSAYPILLMWGHHLLIWSSILLKWGHHLLIRCPTLLFCINQMGYLTNLGDIFLDSDQNVDS